MITVRWLGIDPEPLRSLPTGVEEVQVRDVCGEIRQADLHRTVPQRGQQECEGGEPLLAIDDPVDVRLTRLRQLRHKDQEPHEVAPLAELLEVPQVLPKLVPLIRPPAIVPLEERDRVLARAIEDVLKRPVGGSHRCLQLPLRLSGVSCRLARRRRCPCRLLGHGALRDGVGRGNLRSARANDHPDAALPHWC